MRSPMRSTISSDLDSGSSLLHVTLTFCMVTGPVTRNMQEALRRTYDAMPAPKWVVAAGACALDGGLYAGGYACVGGVAAVIPVDLAIPGCPPTPTALLKGLLALMASSAH